MENCIPNFWEREWKNHSQFSGTGMGGQYSREWPGTGIPAHPWFIRCSFHLVEPFSAVLMEAQLPIRIDHVQFWTFVPFPFLCHCHMMSSTLANSCETLTKHFFCPFIFITSYFFWQITPGIAPMAHTSYLSFLLHRQDFWIPKFYTQKLRKTPINYNKYPKKM